MWNPETRGLVYAQYAARDLRGPVEQIERHGLVSAAGGTLPANRDLGAHDRSCDTSTRRDRFGANVQFTSPVGPRHLLTYGVDAYGDRIASEREDVSLTTGASAVGEGRASPTGRATAPLPSFFRTRSTCRRGCA